MDAKVLAPSGRYHRPMHTTEFHERLKNNPKALATATSNPQVQWGEKGTVLFVWRDCHCGSSIAVTVAQEVAARDITTVVRDLL